MLLPGDAALNVAAIVDIAVKIRHGCPRSSAKTEFVVDYGECDILFRHKASIL